MCIFITAVLITIGFVAWNADGFGLQRGFVMGIYVSIALIVTSTFEEMIRMGDDQYD
jgi:hypothetical protein